MKKVLSFLVLIFVISLFSFSLSFGNYSNYDAPQLEFISNALPLLWGQPKAEVLRLMSIFPDFTCTDYGDQIGCVDRFNSKNMNIFISFFTEDYEERHDNLWKAAITADIQSAQEQQDLVRLLWLKGMKPAHADSDDFSALGALQLYFANETTSMIVYAQNVIPENDPFLLVEFFGISGD